MAYIKSKDIQLFPSAFRGQYDTPENEVFNPASRLTTEYNLTTLSARASRFHQSYVLDYKRDTDDKTIIFNIKGYLFSVKMTTFLATLAPETQQIWAKIKLENIAPDDENNTVDTSPVLKPVEESGTLLDRRLTAEGDFLFLGLSLETDDPTSELTSEEHTLLILEKTGGVWDVPAKSYFRMSAKEISDSGDETKSIDEEFNVEEINVGKINGLTITPADDAVLTIAEGKELKVSGSNKELAGAGSVLTMGGNLTTSGAHSTTFTTTADTELTLPTTGTLATLDGLETLTQKTLTSPILTAPTLGVATATSINGLKIDTTTGTLDIANSKKLTVNDNITVGKNVITLASNKSLTMQYAGLTVGDSSGTGTVNIKTSGTTGRSLTLTGSPSLSGITTTGSGTLALNTNLTVNGENKTFAGAGTSLTIDNSLDIAGTTGQITLGTGAHTLKFTTENNTALTLPTSGKLATIAGNEELINKKVNGLTLTPKTSGFEISGGEESKTLILGANTTINDVLNLTSSATQVGSRTLGTSVKPVYLNEGEVTACAKDFIGMTKVSYSGSSLVDGVTLDIQNYVNSASASPLIIKGYVRGQAQPDSVFKLFIGDIEICSFSPGPSLNKNSVIVSFEIFMHSYSTTGGGFARMISSQSRFVPVDADVETPCNVFDFPIPSGYTRFEIPIKVEGAKFFLIPSGGAGYWDVSADLLILTA